MNHKVFMFLLSFLTASCAVKYDYTDTGGVRIINPKQFKYNKSKFVDRDKDGIDMGAIYVYDHFSSPKKVLDTSLVDKEFIRFFPAGQMLIIPFKEVPTSELANNRSVGILGYFIVKKNKIKADVFQELNGGQTGKLIGRILKNGDIEFFEENPNGVHGSFAYPVQRSKSYWKKIKIENIELYSPNW